MNSSIKITKSASLSSAYYILLIFLTIQILIGAFLIILCESIKYSLLKFLHEIQKNELNIRMYLIEFYSIHLIIFYLCGYVFAKKGLSEAYTNHLKILLKFWNTLICLLSLEGLITAWLCKDSFESVSESVEISLYRGIDAYYENSNWRLIWDNLQFYNQCCGVKDYHDWEAITWLEYEMKRKRDKALTNLEYVSLTPYSCCKIASSCYENIYVDSHVDERSKRMQLQQLLNTNVSEINRIGCLGNLIDRMATVVDLTVILTLVVFVIQFLVSVLMALIFITNRTYKGDGLDVGSESSDYEDEAIVGRLVARNEQLHQQYCTEHGMGKRFSYNHRDSEHRCSSRQCSCGRQRRSSSHEPHRRSSSRDHDHEHRRSSGSSKQRRSSSHDPNHHHEEFRKSVIEPAEEFRRSVLAYEQRRSSMYSNAEGQPRHSNADDFRHSVVEPAEEFRRSVLAYEQRHSMHHSDAGAGGHGQ